MEGKFSVENQNAVYQENDSPAARFQRDLPRLLYFVLPVYCFILSGLLANFFENFLWVFTSINLIFYALLFLLFYVLTNRPRLSAVVLLLVCLVFNIANHYVFRFRGRAMMPIDVLSWKTALNVAGNYDYKLDLISFVCIGLTVVYIYMLIKFTKGGIVPLFGKKRNQFVAQILSIAVLVICLNTHILQSVGLAPYQWWPESCGTMFNFFLAIPSMHIEEPSDYSITEIEHLAKTYQSRDVNHKGTIKPKNIIVIMDEAYGDYSIYPGYESPSDDIYRFIHSLSDNTIKGLTYVPVTGGGTAATEFESITGVSNILTKGNIAYMLYSNERMPSIIPSLNEDGYSSTFFHPYLASGWNREQTYDYMNVMVQTYGTDFLDNPIFYREMLSDKSDFDYLKQLIEESENPIFCLNVTMQNHSGYSVYDKALEDAFSVSVPDKFLEADKDIGRYFTLLNATDSALEDFLGFLKTLDEPTMVVFYGDHQAPLSEECFSLLQNEGAFGDSDIEQTMRRFATPFFIWANYDIEEISDIKISSNYIPMLIAKVANIPMNGFMSYLADLYEDLPVIHSFFLSDGTNTYSSPDYLPDDLREEYERYLRVCYCGMFDSRDSVLSFFRADWEDILSQK